MNSVPNNLFVYAIQQDGGEVHYLSPLPDDYGFEHGLSPQSIMGQFLDGVDRVTPDNFARNSVFVNFLHGVIAKHGPQCPGIVAEAQRTGNGSVAVIDLRVPDLKGAIVPEDIIGVFAVTNGTLGEYHACPKHQVFNQFGIMQLPEWLHEKLVSELKAVA